VKATVGAGALGVALALSTSLSTSASAQPSFGAPGRPRGDAGLATAQAPAWLPGPNGLLGHFGVAAAVGLMRSPDADDRLRGLERIAAMHTIEALALLERAVRTSGSGGLDPRLPDEEIARRDPRALLATVHGLAAWLDNEGARTTLAEVVSASSESLAPRAGAGPARAQAAGDDSDAERVTLARQEAAIALASSGNSAALERLVAAARSGGAEQEAALLALTIHPPSEPVVLGGVALTTPATIAMAARIGDLRTLDAILGVMGASDPALRAAGLAALGAAGDTRAVELARAALHDGDVRVRVAAVDALARFGTPDAPSAVEALIADEATALEGLRIARDVQGEGITRAAAARAAASADPALRGAAIVALGRQTAPSAIRALLELAAAPLLAGDAIGAIARSPSPAALDALEEAAGIAAASGSPRKAAAVAGAPAPSDVTGRRLAARAYFVRRFVRGERSRSLDALLEALAASGEPRDRAVGTLALVALGGHAVDAALSDPDARVRRAGAMGALGHWDARTARRLLARVAVEPDEATRRVLALGWTEASMEPSDDPAPTAVLVERALAGGPDAPAAVFALTLRADESRVAQVDAWLRSRDPVLRAQVARGLGLSPEADAAGRLSRAYAWEVDPAVRRAIVGSLATRAARGAPGGEAAREGVLELAARLDPDAVTRWIASQAVARSSAPRSSAADAGARTTVEAGVREVAWIRLAAADGARAALDRTALLVDSGGRALPIVFDDEGYALVPGVSPGEARLRLAPDSPSYSAPAP
jgi:HEAT repeat protein